ncbi:MAG: adenylosuccinate lyase [Pseudomonadota bacterium]
MTTKTLAVALALTLAPTLSLAMGCNYGKHDQQAMSCAAGSTYDADTNTCVATTG